MTTEYKPFVKQVLPISFLFFRTETTLAELGKFFPIAPELYTEATKYDLRVTGPIHWHYFGFTDPAKPFTLEIALPVADVLSGYDGRFHFKRTETFKCVSIMHDGNWLEMMSSYGKLIDYVTKNQLTPAGVNRELYINVDFANPQANATEIQFGIQ